MVRVKICGITRPEDAQCAVEAGADALGFVFYEKSPRYVTPERARRIVAALPPFVTAVGVFFNEDPGIAQAILEECGIRIAQLHGDEPPEFCRRFSCKVIKAFRIHDAPVPKDVIAGYHVDAFLLDTYHPDRPGGTGMRFRWEAALPFKEYGPVILAGGLDPENVADAVRAVKPYAVDVSSGVERAPGVKDPSRIWEFVQRVRQCGS
jgi:phosphoribosylanthranilate isomerase